ncbi:MAG: hypothetical protein EAY75_06035 [Bacteroidetes bacterium]|nr:MAG: hypothetical protein EAY75_06035 [Bacteroidota bacterium]
MYRITIIILSIPLITMCQTIPFSKAVQQLYFNVDVETLSVDAIISKLSNVASEHIVGKRMASLSVNLDMNLSGNAKKVTHVYKFNKSPLPNMSVETGYIKVTVGEVEGNKKITDIDWCFQFLNETDAKKFFKELSKIFTAISTKQKIADDELNSGQYAEFSIRGENAGGIRDVTFFLGKSADANKYEVKFIPYNEFME